MGNHEVPCPYCGEDTRGLSGVTGCYSLEKAKKCGNYSANENENDWVTDCVHFHGKVLHGEKAHWCPDWDYLPIDETCFEFEVGCNCYED